MALALRDVALLPDVRSADADWRRGIRIFQTRNLRWVRAVDGVASGIAEPEPNEEPDPAIFCGVEEAVVYHIRSYICTFIPPYSVTDKYYIRYAIRLTTILNGTPQRRGGTHL